MSTDTEAAQGPPNGPACKACNNAQSTARLASGVDMFILPMSADPLLHLAASLHATSSLLLHDMESGARSVRSNMIIKEATSDKRAGRAVRAALSGR